MSWCHFFAEQAVSWAKITCIISNKDKHLSVLAFPYTYVSRKICWLWLLVGQQLSTNFPVPATVRDPRSTSEDRSSAPFLTAERKNMFSARSRIDEQECGIIQSAPSAKTGQCSCWQPQTEGAEGGVAIVAMEALLTRLTVNRHQNYSTATY